jgi:hypothetical protein
MPASLDGSPVFGSAVQIQETPADIAVQLNTYFGVDGQQSLFGGQRGRSFSVRGIFLASSPLQVEQLKQQLLSFSDGLTHTLIDTFGNEWVNVVVTGPFSWQGLMRPMATHGTQLEFGRPYTLQMLGLT